MKMFRRNGNDGNFFRFLSDVLLLSALCLFLISVLSPFMTVQYRFIIPGVGGAPIFRAFEVTYWSFSAVIGDGIVTKAFFGDYWFGSNDALAVSSGISWVLILIFVLQVATLVVGFLSLLRIKKLRIFPFVSSSVMIALMVYAFVQASQLGYSLGTYGLGYWFVYLSAFLFLSSSILGLAIKRNSGRKATATPLTR